MLAARTTTQSEGRLPITPARDAERAAHLEILYRLTDRLYRASGLDGVLTVAMDAITEGLGCEKCSILLFDAGGVMRFVAWRGLSDHYRTTLEGHTPWNRETMDPPPIFVSDIAATGESEHVKSTILAENIRSLGFIPLTAQGKVIGKFMVYHAKVRGCSEAEKALAVTIARQLGFAIERVQAEAARRAALNDLVESESRFRLMAEHAPVMIWMSDARGKCLHLNHLLRRYWGVDEKDIAGFDWRNSLHPDDVEPVMGRMAAAVARQENVSVTGRYRNAEGEYRTLETIANPRFAADGTFMGLTGVNIDITERERAQEQRELLLAELNHRVKNTLAVVQGLAYQTFRQTDSLPRKAFDGRLLALAKAHDLLTRSHWESTSLQQLASDTLQLGGANRQRIRAEGPPVSLKPHAALTIALAVHELFTNALKHGALSRESGTVAFCWKHLAEERMLRLEWREEGGPPVTPPKHKGFGSLLLERTLAQDLDGRVDLSFDPSGLVCVIEMPFV